MHLELTDSLVCRSPKLIASANGDQPFKFFTFTGAPWANNRCVHTVKQSKIERKKQRNKKINGRKDDLHKYEA